MGIRGLLLKSFDTAPAVHTYSSETVDSPEDYWYEFSDDAERNSRFIQLRHLVNSRFIQLRQAVNSRFIQSFNRDTYCREQ